MAYKRIKGEVPICSKDFLRLNSQQYSRVTRYSNINFVCPKFNRLTEGGRTFAVTTCQLRNSLREQYPVIAHAPNFDFRTGCREIKRCEESKRTLKNPFASRLAEFNTTLKHLRITEQWHIVPVKFRLGRNRDFLALLLLPLAEGANDGKRVGADWRRLISSASFHKSSDNCERNTQKWNNNN